jgi:hypothetical protein
MINKIFGDSKFIASAWVQLLETKSPQTVIFFSEERKITIEEVMDTLEGRVSDKEIESEISKFFQEVASEAMKKVGSKFSSGLKT